MAAAATATPPAGDVATKPKPEPKPVPPPDLETYAEVGDPVEWFPAGDATQEPWCGIVCQLEFGSQVAVSTLSKHWNDVLPQSPCFHVSDKEGRKEGNQEGGAWRHKPQTVAVRRMMLALGYLRWEKNRLVACEPKVEAKS